MVYYYNDKFEALLHFNNGFLTYSVDEQCSDTIEDNDESIRYTEKLSDLINTKIEFHLNIIPLAISKAVDYGKMDDLVVVAKPNAPLDTIRMGTLKDFVNDGYYITDANYKFFTVIEFINHVKDIFNNLRKATDSL